MSSRHTTSTSEVLFYSLHDVCAYVRERERKVCIPAVSGEI